MRLRIVAVIAALALFSLPSVARAQMSPDSIVSIELVAGDDSTLGFGDKRFAGPFLVTRYDDGLALTEQATIEQYLYGIAEVPFAWPEEALAAQAVAARTYLTRTLLGGRSGDQDTYGYDICATSACQVYSGVSLVNGDYGDRWRAAVDRTEDELLMYGGRPIEAVYTSQVGSRSRSNQDVWASDPVPYLQAVDSPEAGRAPYAEWTVAVSAAQFVEILAADGLSIGGDLLEVIVDDPPEGEGRTEMTVITAEGTDTVLAPDVRGAFNRNGADLFPSSLPARLPDGRVLPQAIPSYTFDLSHVVLPPLPIEHLLPEDERGRRDFVRFDGEGWGHGVGLSQWGARVMADEGSSYEAILTHFYTGVSIDTDSELVPDSVVVGLGSGMSEVRIQVEGTAELLVNGIGFVILPAGEWLLRPSPTGIAVTGIGDTPPHVPLTDRLWPL